jgi:trimethylamine--corrinoid protein Co-methyltransferase
MNSGGNEFRLLSPARLFMNQNAMELHQTALGLERAFDFQTARKRYQDIVDHFPSDPLAQTAKTKVRDMDDLIAEKETYQRIHENGRRVLTEIGMNIVDAPELMEILAEADAIDFDNSTAVFVPLKAEYIDRCLDQVPRALERDPGSRAFGTGATPPFLKRPKDDRLMGASREEFNEIVRVVGSQTDVTAIFSLPVATERAMSGYEAAQVMEKGFKGLKMTATPKMNDEEVLFLKGKPDWVDGTSLIVNLGVMKNMIRPFLRSCRSGNQLLLLDLTIAGQSGAQSPESLLTQIHAQVLFMMILAQTLNPGVVTVHGGIPGVADSKGDLSYTSPAQPLLNAAMGRVNRWITGFPSAQSGGSTSLTEVTEEALAQSARSRGLMRLYEPHIVRHALGALASLNFFSLEKYLEDCQREREAVKAFEPHRASLGVAPMFFPRDDQALDGLREGAEKGNPRNTDHTLVHIEDMVNWNKRIAKEVQARGYDPYLQQTILPALAHEGR